MTRIAAIGLCVALASSGSHLAAQAQMTCDPDTDQLMFYMGLTEEEITTTGRFAFFATAPAPTVRMTCFQADTLTQDMSKTCAPHVQQVTVVWAPPAGVVRIRCEAQTAAPAPEAAPAAGANQEGAQDEAVQNE